MIGNGAVGFCVCGRQREVNGSFAYLYCTMIAILWLGCHCTVFCEYWDLTVVLLMAQKKGLILDSHCHKLHYHHFSFSFSAFASAWMVLIRRRNAWCFWKLSLVVVVCVYLYCKEGLVVFLMECGCPFPVLHSSDGTTLSTQFWLEIKH